jgi:uncharacterized membrane protein
LSDGSVEEDGNGQEKAGLPRWIFVLFLAGFVLVLVGIAVVVAASLLNGGSASGAVVIFIGPFPIVFGAGPGATWLVLIGIILTALSIILFVIMRRRMTEKVG